MTKAKRPTFENFKKKALKDKKVAQEYDALKPEYARAVGYALDIRFKPDTRHA